MFWPSKDSLTAEECVSLGSSVCLDDAHSDLETELDMEPDQDAPRHPVRGRSRERKGGHASQEVRQQQTMLMSTRTQVCVTPLP